jgi:inosose dehydratase
VAAGRRNAVVWQSEPWGVDDETPWCGNGTPWGVDDETPWCGNGTPWGVDDETPWCGNVVGAKQARTRIVSLPGSSLALASPLRHRIVGHVATMTHVDIGDRIVGHVATMTHMDIGDRIVGHVATMTHVDIGHRDRNATMPAAGVQAPMTAIFWVGEGAPFHNRNNSTSREGIMIQVANAPCSWGVIEGVAGERGGYRQVLDEMQASGYAGTELGDWGFMPTDPVALRAELAARDLRLLASWVSVALHDEARHAASEAEAVRTARLLAEVGGPDCLIVLGNDPYADPVRTLHAGRITPELGMTEQQWQTFTGGANRVARAVWRETGLRTVFHHHIGTWVETPEETARLLAETDPQVLGLCFDTGHYRFGGGDPLAGLARHADRIWHVHFKDHDPAVAERTRREGLGGVEAVGLGVFCELGQGDVDFPAVLAWLRARGYDGWVVVEQDVLPGMGSPLESARRNRAYLKGIGL